MTSTAVVAERPTNGHRPNLAEQPPATPLRAPGDDHSAKINKVAEPRRDKPLRGLRQHLAGRRDRRAEAHAQAAPADVAEGMDLTRLYPWLTALVTLVVLLTFVLSYHGLFMYARDITLLPWALSLAVPIGLDVFSLCSLVATFLCRNATWRVRAQCWAFFIGTVALSVSGNAAYAYAEQINHAAGRALSVQQDGAIAGAAVWPALAAGALHLLIISRRHLATQRVHAASAIQAAEAQENADLLMRARAIELIAAGATCKEAADELGVALRNVQRWTQDIRSALDDAKSTTATPKPVARTRGRNNPARA